VALCLSELGICIIGVEGLGDGRVPPTSCRVRYSPKAIMQMQGKCAGSDAAILDHVRLMTVSLLCLEDALTNVPFRPDMANRWRTAWQEGARASHRPVSPYHNRRQFDDFQYAFWDIGSPLPGVRDDIQDLVSAHSFAINKEICQALEQVF
jgi:hypothetical protein